MGSYGEGGGRGAVCDPAPFSQMSQSARSMELRRAREWDSDWWRDSMGGGPMVGKCPMGGRVRV